MKDDVKVVSVLPDLLGTYGDSGNALVVKRRLELRGFQVEFVVADFGTGLPDDGDFYLVGGGEDGPQSKAAELLRAGRHLEKALGHGAALLAVCAGFQILGSTFIGPDAEEKEGVGIFGCRTLRYDGPRSVGELVVEPEKHLVGVPLLTGYENHQGVTELFDGTVGLGRVLAGKGNNVEPRVDGAFTGKAIGTYMHGPVFARNPELCDFFLSLVVGDLESIDDPELERSHKNLYSERIKAGTEKQR